MIGRAARSRGFARAPLRDFLALALLAPTMAGAGSVGLSSVRGVVIPNFAIDDNPVEAGDRYGASFASGDFNGDGVDDLATGDPNDDRGLGSISPSGSAFVQLGAAGSGLQPASPALLLYDNSGGEFGRALAAGDFNGDGNDDLAVGSPQGSTGFENVRGFVRIFYGSTTPGVFGPAVNLTGATGQLGARVGFALAAGDFNGDGYSDLAVGIPGENTNSGAVRVAYGSAGGLLDAGPAIDQDTTGVEDVREAQDLFGYSLAAGDFDGNGTDDLAVGVVNENQFGAVQVFFSTGAGIVPATDLVLSQNSVAGNGELNDQFGWAVAAADFDADGKSDLAIGSPGEALGLSNELTNSGMVVVLWGLSTTGFDLARTQVWGQGGIFGVDTAEIGDRFSAALATGDFNADGFADLAIGQPEEDVTGTNNGALSVHLGSAAGFSQARARFLSAGTDGLPGPGQQHSNYGFAAGTGDFDADGHDDLAIGVPYHDQDGVRTDSGLTALLYGSLDSDGFEDSGTAYWSTTVP